MDKRHKFYNSVNQAKISEHKDINPGQPVNMAKAKTVPLPLLKSGDADAMNAARVDHVR